MVIRGRIENGVVVLENEISLPEGTEVMIEIRAPEVGEGEAMSEERRQRLRETMDRIASLPNKNPGDTFRGVDHDRELYERTCWSSSTPAHGLPGMCRPIRITLA
jgi:predicted DNA-binding antitoxin AbrB/MazE fold protein